ncbi:M28 family peptidase [Bizionia gelidisalsuginis]|uniref:M28 family peptidase n=2 Tax=Bizionia TaxID=283785 RepID=A0A8H2LGJ3_9FLAO|nr:MULTISPECIES: M28 family peptidase [Bizionia]TYB73842.1 M28 family peptidase [Bizionia saleffrena]TYC12805.1 M28 family peptidase [Bizionia gelidisalsuginis]
MNRALLLFYFCILLYTTKAISQTYNPFYGDIVNTVSASNIVTDLTTFENFGIKTNGSTAINNAKNWIVSRYQSLGYTDIVEQPFTYSGNTTNNIIVTKTGSVYPNTFIIIDAHYDTLNGPGTNDNGSGTVLLLEMARLLHNINTEYSIKFIHFSGEEAGLIGSNYYVNNTAIPENLDISLVFNIDQVGGVNGALNDTLICEYDASNPTENNAESLTKTNSLANCISLYSNLSTELSYAYGSDYVPFENAGKVITGLYEKNETPYSHTANDVLANMDPNYVFEVTKGSLGAALEFAVGISTLSTQEVLPSQKKNIKIYPNPSKGLVTVSSNFKSMTYYTVFISDILGKKVYEKALNKQTQTLDLSRLKKGVYILTFKNKTEVVSKKLILN